MIAEQLRRSLLQAAIQGKLTVQLESDGNARDLLKEIEKEKGRPITEVKIKKGKLPPEITEHEFPFEIPNNWCWVKLGMVGETNVGLTYKPSEISNSGTLILRSGNIQNDKLDYSDNVFVNSDIPESKKCHIGDILICARNGSKRLVGKAAIIDKDGMSFGAFMALYRSPFNAYIQKYLWSPYFRADFDGVNTTTINQITQANLIERLLPLPPLPEQERIVKKLDTILLEIEELKKEETKLLTLQKAFPMKMKDSILQAAIKGKLTDQLETDGDARDLLKEIKKEKISLSKEGKIKKDKPLPEISEEEIPFDIPDNWCWVRLGDITFNHGQKKPEKEFTYIDITSIDNRNHSLGDLTNIIKPENAPSRARKIICEGDVLYATVRPYLMNICLIDQKIEPEPIASTGFAVVSTVKSILTRYLFYCFLSPMFDSYANDHDNSKGVAYPAINDDKFSKALIPLPPLVEQSRIVERVKELLPLCDSLE